jgi:lipopolysaccharide/colanic/teichoic acid biosynthesis glycosyltransferase
LLVVAVPLLALAMLAIRLESKGSPVFVQLRTGHKGRPFRMFKLRTMRLGSEAATASWVAHGGKLRDDPRVTRVGRWLRRWSIDELPQLLNVVRGEMSLVGPRPEEARVFATFPPEHRVRVAVKPGLTGPMQVGGRGELGLGERFHVEREYVERATLAGDLRLLAETVPAVVSGRGAY